MDPKTNDPVIAALLREHASYVRRGLPDRVAQVDEQLALRGYQTAPEEPAPAPEPAGGAAASADTPPPGRRARPRSSTIESNEE